jgi:hypothetical protein
MSSNYCFLLSLSPAIVEPYYFLDNHRVQRGFQVTENLQVLQDQYREIIERLNRLETLHSLNIVKEGYTVADVAKRMNRSPYCVRQWANRGHIKASKVRGNGRDGEWRISADELARIQREGPSPERTFDNHGDGTANRRAS